MLVFVTYYRLQKLKSSYKVEVIKCIETLLKQIKRTIVNSRYNIVDY